MKFLKKYLPITAIIFCMLVAGSMLFNVPPSVTEASRPSDIGSYSMPLRLAIPFPVTGKVLFVDSTYGSNSYRGNVMTQPLRSITYALTKCTADNGDFIIVMEGYDNNDIDTETNGDDTPISVDVDGVTILSAGRSVSVAAIASADSIFTIDADRVRMGALPGCRWAVKDAVAGTTSTIIEVSAGSVDGEFYGFETESGADADGYDELITISATSHGTWVHDNTFVGNTTDTDEGIMIGGTVDRVKIENNRLIECGASGGAIVSASIHTNCTIRGNIIDTRTASKKGINFSANATGIICDNRIYVEADADGVVNGLCAEFENYVNDAETTSAFISPAAGSIT